MNAENLIDKLISGEKVECNICEKGYFVPFNTTADKAHSFNCSNPNCKYHINIDKVIEIE